MSDCCSSSGDETRSRKLRCPVCGTAGSEVASRTIRLHILAPWLWSASAGRYSFCEQPDCAVVYFGDDGSLILKANLRTQVGVKEADRDALLCHCYGVSRKDLAREPSLRDFVVAATRDGQCACDTRNPSGRCCLKDFSRPQAAEQQPAPRPE